MTKASRTNVGLFCAVHTFSRLLQDKSIWAPLSLPSVVLQMLEECGLLGKGSVILADNVLFPGAPKFLRYIRKSGLYEWKIHRAMLEYSKGIRDGMAELVFQGIK